MELFLLFLNVHMIENRFSWNREKKYEFFSYGNIIYYLHGIVAERRYGSISVGRTACIMLAFAIFVSRLHTRAFAVEAYN